MGNERGELATFALPAASLEPHTLERQDNEETAGEDSSCIFGTETPGLQGGTGPSVFDLSVSTRSLAGSEGPGPLNRKQKQACFSTVTAPLRRGGVITPPTHHCPLARCL